MDSLLIHPTHNSPFVSLNAQKGELKISGDSRPENSQEFFDPLMQWLSNFKSYAEHHLPATNLTLTVALDYFNSSSAKCLFDFIFHYSELRNLGHSTTILWQYESDDDDVLEAGQDLSEMLGIEFDFVPID